MVQHVSIPHITMALADGAGASRHVDATQDTDVLPSRYRGALVRYFLRHLGNMEDAEDLAQEVFARFAQYKAASTIRNLEAFLFGIAGNLLRDRFRRDQTHCARQHFPIDKCVEGQLGEVPSAERVYQEQQRLQAFLDALDELSSRTRTVFLLQRYEGMTYSAVAKRLGISVSAVEKHMMKAILHFDARLDLS
jgi:RNA polymerase sigma-70 factor (ECF subfamily)